MILTSKRCFLNVLTQLLPKQVLLEANYYVLDVPFGEAINASVNEVTINDDCTWTENKSKSRMGRFNVKYSNTLDPSPHVAISLTETENPYDSFIAHLNDPGVMYQVYDLLFRDTPKGNGLQIMIFMDSTMESIINFGHIICQYLSMNFGADIQFLDASYFPIKAHKEYNGDKQRAVEVITKLRDMKLLDDFNRALSKCGLDKSMNNLTTWFSLKNVQQLIHLYELLFPTEPLPPDNYTKDRVQDIIIHKTASYIPSRNETLMNLQTSDAFIDDLCGRYSPDIDTYADCYD